MFVVTSDVDWASEFCVRDLLDALGQRGVRPTVFATHSSDFLAHAASEGRAELGVHPNFLPGSTHGQSVDAVIEHMFQLVPGAPCFRSHSFVDGSQITDRMAARGVAYDSNLCLYLQPDLKPLFHWSGIWRFPVFWEDDVHWRRGGDWSFARYEDLFFTPGLKIINVHPFNFALNAASDGFYQAHKGHCTSLTDSRARQLRWLGAGTRTFVLSLIDAVLSQGHRFYTLGELYEHCCPASGLERAA
jgi:hypothetical protein